MCLEIVSQPTLKAVQNGGVKAKCLLTPCCCFLMGNRYGGAPNSQIDRLLAHMLILKDAAENFGFTSLLKFLFTLI